MSSRILNNVLHMIMNTPRGQGRKTFKPSRPRVSKRGRPTRRGKRSSLYLKPKTRAQKLAIALGKIIGKPERSLFDKRFEEEEKKISNRKSRIRTKFAEAVNRNQANLTFHENRAKLIPEAKAIAEKKREERKIFRALEAEREKEYLKNLESFGPTAEEHLHNQTRKTNFAKARERQKKRINQSRKPTQQEIEEKAPPPKITEHISKSIIPLLRKTIQNPRANMVDKFLRTEGFPEMSEGAKEDLRKRGVQGIGRHKHGSHGLTISPPHIHTHRIHIR